MGKREKLTWMGKLVGGAIGLALGGPTGALLGIVLGHAVDEEDPKRDSDKMPPSGRHYATLQCSPDDSSETIKTRYRKLVREFHPDTIAAKGLPEDFTRFAQGRFNEIQEAYAAIKKERGIP